MPGPGAYATPSLFGDNTKKRKPSPTKVIDSLVHSSLPVAAAVNDMHKNRLVSILDHESSLSPDSSSRRKRSTGRNYEYLDRRNNCAAYAMVE